MSYNADITNALAKRRRSGSCRLTPRATTPPTPALEPSVRGDNTKLPVGSRYAPFGNPLLISARDFRLLRAFDLETNLNFERDLFAPIRHSSLHPGDKPVRWLDCPPVIRAVDPANGRLDAFVRPHVGLWCAAVLRFLVQVFVDSA